VLFEAYAVLTRLPAPWRVSAVVAERLLNNTFAATATLASLPNGTATWSLVRGLAQRELTGGVAHDAHVVACAAAAGAHAIVTFNRRDFARLDLAGMALIVPE
jgi:predicted nucleic acid-binding protein